MNKIVCLFSIIVFCLGCSSNSTIEKHQGKRNNITNVRDQIKEIVIEDLFIGNYSWPMIIDNYIFIIDYKTANEYIHIFDKNNFKYMTSTGLKGQGPGEITLIGDIAEDKVNRKFYVSDHGKNKIFSYDLDSAIIDPAYSPTEKMKMSEQVFPDKYEYVNDTLSIGVTIQRLGNGDFNPVVAKFNMETGEISPMGYTIHPDVKKKRICFAISMVHGIYVETYIPHDLMSICSLDGELKYNIYGPKWDAQTHGIDHYKGVAFCNDRIVALYSGEDFVTTAGKPIYATKFLVFDLEGNYLKTLETGYPIINYCYDNDNHRLIMSLNDKMQFAYLDLGKLLD